MFLVIYAVEKKQFPQYNEIVAVTFFICPHP